MPKIFSVASWNVEHFRNKTTLDLTRVERVAKFISGQNGGPPVVPDVFALYEVEGKFIYQEFMDQFPDHRFHLTEGRQSQEIFVGVHRKFQTFTTQRLEFKTGREYQRPGLLLTLRIDNINYSLLFLHVRSGDAPEDFGLRDAGLLHAFALKIALDKTADTPANFIFLGDLNTMGVDDPMPRVKDLDMSAEKEIARIGKWAKKRKMMLVPKDRTLVGDGDPDADPPIEDPREVTWYNGSDNYDPSNLDHVVASEHMDIRGEGGMENNIAVLGWPKLPEAQWDDWLDTVSDHALLYFEVW